MLICVCVCVCVGLPALYRADGHVSPDEPPPCVLERLCELHDGLVVEAKGIKQHYFKPYIQKLYQKQVYTHTHVYIHAYIHSGFFPVFLKCPCCHFIPSLIQLSIHSSLALSFLNDDLMVERKIALVKLYIKKHLKYKQRQIYIFLACTCGVL